MRLQWRLSYRVFFALCAALLATSGTVASQARSLEAFIHPHLSAKGGADGAHVRGAGGVDPDESAPVRWALRPVEKASAEPAGGGFRWRYVGPVLTPACPRVVSITRYGPTRLALGFEAVTRSTALTVVWDTQSHEAVETLWKPVPLSMLDPHGNLSGLSARGDVMRQIIHQRAEDGTFATRIVVLPRPETASASEPYLPLPARQAPDGALILLGSGRDRFYRINPALGSVKTILPAEALEVVDYDITQTGAILAMDGFEHKLVWLDLDGNVILTLPLSANEQGEPRFYYLSVASADEHSAWVGTAVRQADGSFIPEIQRIRGQLRERQRLIRGDGTFGMPLVAAPDGAGGVYVADEGNWVYHVSSSAVVTRVWRVRPPDDALGNAAPICGDGSLHITDSGTLTQGLGAALDAAGPAIEACYRTLLEVEPEARGTLRLKLVTRDRNVSEVAVYARDFEALGLESCLALAFRKLKLPSIRGRQVFRVELVLGEGPRDAATGEASSD